MITTIQNNWLQADRGRILQQYISNHRTNLITLFSRDSINTIFTVVAILPDVSLVALFTFIALLTFSTLLTSLSLITLDEVGNCLTFFSRGSVPTFLALMTILSWRSLGTLFTFCASFSFVTLMRLLNNMIFKIKVRGAMVFLYARMRCTSTRFMDSADKKGRNSTSFKVSVPFNWLA